jgi:hypothetical protein
MDCEQDETCKIAAVAENAHEWAHVCMKTLNKQELYKAHDIGHKILDLLNEQQAFNAVKFLAVFEALSVGADVLDHDAHELMHRDLGTLTIN